MGGQEGDGSGAEDLCAVFSPPMVSEHLRKEEVVIERREEPCAAGEEGILPAVIPDAEVVSRVAREPGTAVPVLFDGPFPEVSGGCLSGACGKILLPVPDVGGTEAAPLFLRDIKVRVLHAKRKEQALFHERIERHVCCPLDNGTEDVGGDAVLPVGRGVKLERALSDPVRKLPGCHGMVRVQPCKKVREDKSCCRLCLSAGLRIDKAGGHV